MPKDFYLDIIKHLRGAGFAQVPGGKGSHEKWRNEALGLTVIVARAKSRHTANEILKAAGLPKAF